jgi:hypothetical protein
MLLLKHDPGNCPVCDCPHTACTSPGYDPATGTSSRVVVTEPHPPRDGDREPRSAPTVVVRRGEFTTATYVRKQHNPRQARKVDDEPPAA